MLLNWGRDDNENLLNTATVDRKVIAMEANNKFNELFLVNKPLLRVKVQILRICASGYEKNIIYTY